MRGALEGRHKIFFGVLFDCHRVELETTQHMDTKTWQRDLKGYHIAVERNQHRAGTMYPPSNVIAMVSGRSYIMNSKREPGQALVLAFSL